jgi:coenzyme F420-reducing hydrogenase beta subunit
MAILDNVEDIRAAAGSRYYPVELSGPLQQIWTEEVDRRYAVVGLPCFLHGVRRAMARHGKLRRRIAYLLGLACGLCPTAHYTEVLSAWAGISPFQVQTVGYRFKDGIRVGWDYGFRAQDRSGKWSRQVGLLETFGYLWGRYYFAHNTCNYCDDVYAEVADAVFMDAWLPDLLSDTRGTSIVVVRHPRLKDIFTTGVQEGTCTLRPCPIEDVLTSQESVIQQKREAIRQRIAVAREQGMWLPKMRAQAAATVSARDRQTVRRRMRTIRASKKFWHYFRRLPPAALPFFFWAVDTYAGGIVYGVRSFVGVVRKMTRRIVSKSSLLRGPHPQSYRS